MDILFITTNRGKFNLSRERLAKYNINVIQASLKLEENQDVEVANVARYKALQALEKSPAQFIIEDSALYIDSLNGFPGAMAKLVLSTLGDAKVSQLVRNERNKSAYIKGVLIYGDPKTGLLKDFIGIYEGEVATEPRGENMRGWDALRIFIPKGWSRTLAELSDSEWLSFLEESRQGDHYEQFGQWAQREIIDGLDSHNYHER